ncbi:MULTISPECIES: type II secretion system protein N [unclassified Vibrio]|uniref:Type II secretion system protein N n=1 Tax=Vibrio sp. HB236076 TaxID=3232307 RepID=A0AB39HET0_9VIBR|nr:type II secretion system protein N [Vibrio sp. HB161653]MDP5255224.1 type II secretion system protein N [Vibrio sp. HB161653]
MRRAVLYSLIFLLFFAVSVVISVPVTQLLPYMPLPKALQLQGVSGTLWQGKAQEVYWDKTSLGQVSWDWQSSALWQGDMAYQVRFGEGSAWQLRGRGVVGSHWSGQVFARHVFASMPAAHVARQLDLPVPISVTGQVELTLRDWQYAQPWCVQGEGEVVWNTDAVGTPLGPLQLGPVITDIQCQNNAITAKGEQKSDQVSAAFSAELSQNGRYQSQAWFQPGREFPEQMASQLQWLGKPDNKGQYQFDHKGRLRL